MKMDLVDLALGVLKDWKVIVITILMLIFIAIANYTVNYRKKPPRIKRRKKIVTETKTEKKEESPKAS